jgi:AraC-like DNA-binding protein
MHLANRDDLGHAELWLPELALAGCVRAAVVRDTRRAHAADRVATTYLPAQALLPRDWHAWMRSVAAAPDDGTRMQLIADFLRPRWQAAALRDSNGGRYRDWAEALALRAATSRGGRSLRQIERRIKRWAGLPMREIQAMARAESALLAATASPRGGEIGWAELAVEQGYADQPHLCRTTKRLTGFSPAELARRLPEDDALWAYRLWL